MEVYILDSLYRRDQVVDKFESLIWTERFKDLGDFQLVLNSTRENRALFAEGTLLAMNESFYVMVVENVEDITDSEGRTLLKLTGRDISTILEDRIAKKNGLTRLEENNYKWVITDTPAAIARKIFRDICLLGVNDVGDIIPMVYEGRGPMPDDTIAEPSEIITVELDLMTVYKAIKDICDLYDMGFRLIRNFDTSQLYFDIYTGSDRTTAQSTLPAVVFSPDLDNLQNTRAYSTIAGYKNIALCISPIGSSVVTAQDIDPSIDGFNRRVLLIKADDITDTDPAVNEAKRIQRAKEELSKNRRFSGFDGELSQTSTYKYGKDYYLGDLTELRNTDGATNNMQVVEQIFVSDKEGERSYPTLAITKFITPGSWSAWDFNQVWFDLDTDPVTWSES